MVEQPRKRRSRVLEYLQQRQEEAQAEAEAAGQEGGDQPFPDFASELGLGQPETGGQQ